MAKERSSCLLLSHMWCLQTCVECQLYHLWLYLHTSRRPATHRVEWALCENFTLRLAKNLSRNSYDLSLIGEQKLSWGHIWTINSEKHPLKTPNHRVLHGLQPVVTYSDYTYEQGSRQGAKKGCHQRPCRTCYSDTFAFVLQILMLLMYWQKLLDFFGRDLKSQQFKHTNLK